MIKEESVDKYYIYLFVANYKTIKEEWELKLKLEVENIILYIQNITKKLGAEVIATDSNSLTITGDFNNPESEDKIKQMFSLVGKIKQNLNIVKELTNEFNINFDFHAGIIKENELEKNPFRRKNNQIKNSEDYPFILLSEKIANIVIESYNVTKIENTKLSFTDGIEITEIERIKNIYFEREEEYQLLDFTNSAKNRIIYLYGELGSGKTMILNNVIKKSNDNIVYITEKRHCEKEFTVIISIIEKLLFGFEENNLKSYDSVLNDIENSSLGSINKSNLNQLISKYFLNYENSEETIAFTSIIERLKLALHDSLTIYSNNANDNKILVFIDNYQFVSENCNEILFSIIPNNTNIKMKFIFAGRDKFIFENNFKSYIDELLIPDLKTEEIKLYLRSCFPGKFATKSLLAYLNQLTGGNFYCLKEFLIYLVNAKAILKTNKYLKIDDIKDIPENLMDMFEKKIEYLDKNSLNILKIISIFGDSFNFGDFDSLLHILNYSEDEVISLRNLVTKGFLTEKENNYKISRPETVDIIYRTIPKNNRVIIHNILGEMYEKKKITSYSFKIFYNYYRAENHEKLFSLLPTLLKDIHTNLDFNALKNVIEISDNLIYQRITQLETVQKNEFKKKIAQAKNKLKSKLNDEKTENLEKEQQVTDSINKDTKDIVDKTIETTSVQPVEQIEPVEIFEEKATEEIMNLSKLWISVLLYKTHTMRETDKFNNIRKFEKAIKYGKIIDDKEYLINLYIILTQLYLDNNRYKKFITTTELAIDIATEHRIDIKKARLQNMLAIYYLSVNDIQRAQPFIDATINLKIDNKLEQMKETLKMLGLYYSKIGDYRQSAFVEKRLLDLYKAENNIEEILPVLFNIASMSTYNKEYSNAEKCYKEIMNLYSYALDNSIVVEIELKLGVLASYQNHFLQSINSIEKVIEKLKTYFKENGKLLIEAYIELGKIFLYFNEENSAMEAFENAALESEKLSLKYRKRNQLIFHSNLKMAICDLHFDKLDEANSILNNCKEMAKNYFNISLLDIFSKIALISENEKIDEIYEPLIAKIEKIRAKTDSMIIFEIYISLIMALKKNRQYVKISNILPSINTLLSHIYDYNMISVYRKISLKIKMIFGARRKSIISKEKNPSLVRKRINRWYR